MFGFKKEHCWICESKTVINVGKPIGHLCEKHMLETYKDKFLAHQGRKIIIPPKTPDKYTSYQIETVASLKSYGLTDVDIAPLVSLFSEIPQSECYVVQSKYEVQDFLNIEALETASGKRKTSMDAAPFILLALGAYMNSGGVALPPDGNEDVIIYPLRS